MQVNVDEWKKFFKSGLNEVIASLQSENGQFICEKLVAIIDGDNKVKPQDTKYV